MLTKIQKGLLVGAGAGVIDVLPMIAQKLSWDANLSAFSLWVVVGFLVASSTLKFHPIIKGLIIAFAVLLPTAILVGWKEPVSLVPISIMTALLGSGVGWVLRK